MKLFEQLTRREKSNYRSSKNYTGKYAEDKLFIDYLFENNTTDEIREWFENKASTVGFPGADLISVYAQNRIIEMLKREGISNDRKRED